MRKKTNTYTLLDCGDRRALLLATRPEIVATRKYADQIARLGLRYRDVQPYEPKLIVITPTGETVDFDEWLNTIEAPIMIIETKGETAP